VDNLAGLAALLSFLFALVVAAQWVRSHRPSFAFWTLGLLIFAAAAAAQSLGETQGFEDHVLLFRLFYLLGGALGVIYLALGTLYLFVPRRVADVSALVLAVLTAVVAVDAFVAPVHTASLATPCGLFGGAFSSVAPVALAAVIFNIVGTVVFAGGAAWSGWRFLRPGRLQRPAHRRSPGDRRRLQRRQDQHRHRPLHAHLPGLPRWLRGRRDGGDVRRIPLP
jgi:hypothetical protein